MKNKSAFNLSTDGIPLFESMYGFENTLLQPISPSLNKEVFTKSHTQELAEVLVITSYPPRECGIATYSHDLIKALNNKFSSSLSMKVCALESGPTNNNYSTEVKLKLDTACAVEYANLAKTINRDNKIQIVLIQHEFGFFRDQEQSFLEFLYELTKPVVIVFHTVLPQPNEQLKSQIKSIAAACESIIVMTNNSAGILTSDYELPEEKISVIAHGTHLVPHLSKKFLKRKYGLSDRKVLTTFGLLSSGKSIETTIEALPAIVKETPEVMFLILGKTHPEVVKREGEKYREMLEHRVKELSLEKNVLFVNLYLSLPVLLEYLQLTDIYLFTTNDPNQAVSGTFVYAMSCACPIISTPIPHARDILTEDTGIIIDFRNSQQLATSVNLLLNDESLRQNISSNVLQKIVFTAWENSAEAHASLFSKIAKNHISLHYNLPKIDLNHFKKMTTEVGMIQFSKINQPDLNSGYTLDDNARALIATCMFFELTRDETCFDDISIYLNFIKFCQHADGNFLNYVDTEQQFTDQNKLENLDDSNGRALWALGYLVSLTGRLPSEMIVEAEDLFEKALPHIRTVHSTRAMAFAIKGLTYYHMVTKSPENIELIKIFANRMVQMYKHESSKEWKWFESYLTYANSILPEAMLNAWLVTDTPIYKDIALSSFNFLLSHIFNENGIEVISNRTWMHKGEKSGQFGEQPIDVAYTVMTLSRFFDTFNIDEYCKKMEIAFDWFLGKNRLHQIIYNPCTGGCYDGLEETNVNLNQGAESTVSYLMARLTVQKYKKMAIHTLRRKNI